MAGCSAAFTPILTFPHRGGRDFCNLRVYIWAGGWRTAAMESSEPRSYLVRPARNTSSTFQRALMSSAGLPCTIEDVRRFAGFEGADCVRYSERVCRPACYREDALHRGVSGMDEQFGLVNGVAELIAAPG